MKRDLTLVQSRMRSISILPKLLLVLLAFFLVGGPSEWYTGELLQKHLFREADEFLANTQLKIDFELHAPETMLSIVSGSVREKILQGEGEEEIRAYFQNITSNMHGSDRMISNSFHSIYGFFDCFGGKLIH